MSSVFGRIRSALGLVRHHHNILFFVGGFLFDWATVRRIDSWPDIAIMGSYLIGLTILLVLQYREEYHLWTPRGRVARVWQYNVEALHFLYGGFLSINVVLYLRSITAGLPIVFFVLLVVVMLINELPPVRRVGHHLRLGLYAFCLGTLMIYLVPLVLGTMGDVVFVVSLAVTAVVVTGVTWLMSRKVIEPLRFNVRLFTPAAAVLVALLVLYFARLIPPVPLSLQGHGIYYGVERVENGDYLLRTLAPHLDFFFWRDDARPFRARPGDVMVYFVRIFAPSRFHHDVTIRWERWDEATGSYVTTDRIPLKIVGGRDLGYRGYAVKENFDPGDWRVGAETADGRPIGTLRYRVLRDNGQNERRWRTLRM